MKNQDLFRSRNYCINHLEKSVISRSSSSPINVRLLMNYVLTLVGLAFLILVKLTTDISGKALLIFGIGGLIIGMWDIFSWRSQICTDGFVEGLNPFKELPRWAFLVIILPFFLLAPQFLYLFFAALLLHLTTTSTGIRILEKRTGQKIFLRISRRILFQNLLLALFLLIIGWFGMIMILSSFVDAFYDEVYVLKFRAVTATGEPVLAMKIDSKATTVQNEKNLPLPALDIQEKQAEYWVRFDYRSRQSPFFDSLHSQRIHPDKFLISVAKEGFQERTVEYSTEELMENYLEEKEGEQSDNFIIYTLKLPDIVLEATWQGQIEWH